MLGNVNHKGWGGPDKRWTGRCFNLEYYAKVIHYKLLHEGTSNTFSERACQQRKKEALVWDIIKLFSSLEKIPIFGLGLLAQPEIE